MRDGDFQIKRMTRAHCKACRAITEVSEPWRTLQERIDFPKYIVRRQAYVCIVEDNTAGFLIFTPEPVFARGGYLRAIGVDPAMRKNGVGSALLSFAERETARWSQNLFLCVSSFNGQARAFYKHRGYSRVGRLPDLIKQGESEHIYWKQLRQ